MRQLILAVLLTTTTWAQAWAAEPSPAQKSAMQSIISKQLDAFDADRDAEAFSYAAPFVQQYFKNVDIFMSMVKRGYSPVHKHRAYSFGESFTDQLGRNAQRVVIDADDGKRYEALYTLEQQPDGTWRISGCTLLEIAGSDV